MLLGYETGKTTLVDELLKATERSRRRASGGADQTAAVDLNRLMDSGELEKERGITITSKVTRMEYKLPGDDDTQYILNIVDTPGHADFCGEVDRVLSVRVMRKWLLFAFTKRMH
eukprot:scaffold3784_cov174-Amphora_coffeaeformis.AAC.6